MQTHNVFIKPLIKQLTPAGEKTRSPRPHFCFKKKIVKHTSSKKHEYTAVLINKNLTLHTYRHTPARTHLNEKVPETQSPQFATYLSQAGLGCKWTSWNYLLALFADSGAVAKQAIYSEK